MQTLDQSYPSLPRGGGPAGAAGWWRGNRALVSARTWRRTASASVRISAAGIRRVLIPAASSQSSRTASRQGRSPSECASPSTSIANPASLQKKSSTQGPVGCWRRNFSPEGRCRSQCHRITSGSVILRRSWRALRVDLGLAFGEMSFSISPPPCSARSPSPRRARGGFIAPSPRAAASTRPRLQPAAPPCGCRGSGGGRGRPSRYRRPRHSP
jgi:hypothetical protein